MENPKIEWVQNLPKKALRFIFNGTLTEQNAVSGIEKWRKSFSTYPGEKITVIWNCLNMTGYDSGARNSWQSAIKEMKSQ